MLSRRRGNATVLCPFDQALVVFPTLALGFTQVQPHSKLGDVLAFRQQFKDATTTAHLPWSGSSRHADPGTPCSGRS